VEIHWRNVKGLREEERLAVEGRLEALAADHQDLIDLRISAKPTRHHRRGGQEVRISCQARGTELVAARTRPELILALNEALDAFEREVRRLRERRRDRRVERPAPPPVLGIIDRVFAAEGYGFILTDAGEQVYFHRNAVHGGLEFERLEEGQRVGLNVEGGEKGPQATAVVAPPPETPAP
jgi:cold shock CspA family protein/ribosome-associated translation inhibitor RaiA